MDITIKHSLITFSGAAINALLGGLFYILVIRVLGPSQFGVFSIAVTVLTLVADIANLGSDAGLVRFVSKYIKADHLKAYRFLKLSLEIRLIISLIVTVLGLIFAPLIANLFFEKAELIAPLRLAFLGVFSAQLFAFSLASLQALQRFSAWSGIQVGSNLLRLIIVLSLISISQLNLSTGLITYIFIPILGFIASLLFLPKQFLKTKTDLKLYTEFFQFSKWISLTVLLAAVSSRLDTLLSGKLLTAEEVGLYAAALQPIALIIPQVMRSIDTVIAPKMAALDNEKQLINYLKQTLLLVLGLVVLGFGLIPIASFLIPLVYGPAYFLSGDIFIILAIAMLIFLLTVPINGAIIYYLAKPKLYTYVALGNLFLTAAAGWFLINAFRSFGAALTVLVSMSFNLVVPTVWLIYQLRKKG